MTPKYTVSDLYFQICPSSPTSEDLKTYLLDPRIKSEDDDFGGPRMTYLREGVEPGDLTFRGNNDGG